MPRSGEIPEWAQRERASDLEWIRENLHILQPAARQGFAQSGRGALISDTTVGPVHHEKGYGHPLYYLSAEEIEKQPWEDVKRLVRGYDPRWELVCVLLKQGRESAYRVGVPTLKK